MGRTRIRLSYITYLLGLLPAFGAKGKAGGLVGGMGLRRLWFGSVCFWIDFCGSIRWVYYVIQNLFYGFGHYHSSFRIS